MRKKGMEIERKETQNRMMVRCEREKEKCVESKPKEREGKVKKMERKDTGGKERKGLRRNGNDGKGNHAIRIGRRGEEKEHE